MADDLFSMFPPIETGDPYGAAAYQSMGGLNARDVFTQLQQFRQQQDAQQMPQMEAPLDTRVPMDQFVDWPTYQQVVKDSIDPMTAYDEYVDVALPRQLQDMGMSPQDQKQSIENFKASVARPAGKMGVAGEIGNELMIGTDMAAQDLRGTAQRYLPDWLTSSIESLGEVLGMPSLDDVSKQRLEARTPEMRAAAGKEFVSQDEKTGDYSLGPAWSDWRSYASGLLTSLPESAAIAAGSLGVGSAMRGLALARGMAPAVANRLGALATYVTGGVGEGASAGEQSYRQVLDETYNEYRKTMPEAEARQKSLEDANQAYKLTFATTAPVGGLGEVALSPLARGTGRSMARRVAIGTAGEVAEEVPQSAGQQFSENYASQGAFPNRPLMRGVVNAGVAGGVLGLLQGGAQSAAVNALSSTAAESTPPPEVPPPTPPPLEPEAPGAESSMAAFRPSGATSDSSSETPATETAAIPTGFVDPNLETYARVITEGVRPLLAEEGVKVGANQYKAVLDGIENAEDPVAALNEAVESLQADTRAKAAPIGQALAAIRDRVQAGVAIDQSRGSAVTSTPTQDAIRQALNITSNSGIKRTRQVWLEHFDKLNAIRETERAAAEIRIMQAERDDVLGRYIQAEYQRSLEGGGDAPARTMISTAQMAEAASVIDDALGAIDPKKQAAIRQRADQLLQETVHAANQRANQRGNAGNSGAQPRASGGPGVAGGSVQNRGSNPVAGLNAQQRKAVAGAAAPDATSGTVASRLIEKVASGEADPRLLGLLVLADEVTQQIVTDANAQFAVPEETNAPIQTQAPAAEAQPAAPVAQAPVEPTVAKPQRLKRGKPAVAAPAELPPVPSGLSGLGGQILSTADEISAGRTADRALFKTKSTGRVRAGVAAEVPAQSKLKRGTDAGTGTGDLQRRRESTTRLPERAAGTREDQARLKKQQQVIGVLMSKHGYTREEAWNQVQAEDDDVWAEAGWTQVDGGWKPQTLSPDLERTIVKGSINEVLEQLKKTLTSPLQRLIAARLQQLGLTTTITLEDDLHYGGKPANGVYRSADNSILIDPTKADDKTVLHEILHAATVAALRSPATESQRIAAKRMHELYNYAEAQPSRLKHYGFKTVEEFVAEAYTNPGFQKHLESIKLPGPSRISALSAFKRFVLRLIGVEKTPTILSEALLTGEDLFDNRVFKLPVSMAERTLKKGSTFSGKPSDAIVGNNATGGRRAIAYARKDGKYTYYESTDEIPKGDPDTKVAGLTRQQVEAKMKGAGLSVVAPRKETQEPPSTEPPKKTESVIPGYRDGKLQIVAYKQDDDTWNVYESDTDNVTTDPQAKFRNLPDEAAVQTLLSGGDYRTRPVSAKARLATGGGGGANTANQTPSASVAPDGPARDLVHRGTSHLLVQAQDRFRSLMNLGREAEATFPDLPEELRIHDQVTRRNAEAMRRSKGFGEKHVEPMRKHARRIMKDYGKTQKQIEDDWIDLHFIERSENKERKLDPSISSNPSDPYLVKLRQDKAAAEARQAAVQKKSPAYLAEVVKFAEAGKRMMDDVVDLRVAYGLMSPETAEGIKTAYKYYAPIQTGKRTKSGKKATGASAVGTVPFQRMQEIMLSAIYQGENNLLAQHVRDLARYAETHGQGIVDENGKPLVHMGQHTVVKVNPRDFTIEYGTDTVSPMSPYAIPVFDGGQRMYMEIDDKNHEIATALKGFSSRDHQSIGMWLIGASSWLNRLSAIGKTATSPTFTLWNAMRDIQTTVAQLPKDLSRGRFLLHLKSPDTWGSAVRSVFTEAFTDKTPPGLYKDVDTAGGLITRQASWALDPLIAEAEGSFRPTIANRLKRGFRHPTDTRVGKILTAASQAVESWVRLAIYKTAEEKYRNVDGLSPEAAKSRAAVVSKNTTVNFETRGSTPLAPLFLFANAKIQGMHTSYQKLVKEKNPYTWISVATFMMLGLAAASSGYKNSDKDKDGKSRYGKIQQSKRDGAIVFEEGAIGIPIPQEYSPFYALANTIGDGIWGDTESSGARMASRMLRVLAQTFSPLNTPQQDITGYKSNFVDYLFRTITPSVLLPAYDIRANENTFGSEIVGKLKENKARGMPLREMYSKNENSLAVNSAKMLNEATGLDVAPAQLKYIAKAFDPLSVPFWMDLLGGEKPLRYPGEIQNPFMRRFTANATSFADDDNYKEAKQEVMESKYFVANPRALRRGTPAPDQRQLAELQTMFTNVDKQITALYKDFKDRPREDDLAINTRKQELQQLALKEYYRITGRGGG